MAERADSDVGQGTTHDGLILPVIEHQSSCRQRASCDLNGVLTLRGFGRSVHEGVSVVPSNGSHKV